MTDKVDVITIDGPVASGKGSVSSGVAKALGFNVLDSGAIYRIAALAAVDAGVDLNDETAVVSVAKTIKPRFSNQKIFLGEKEVTLLIREEKIGLAASKIATYPKLREALFDLQKSCAKAPGLVADGRDMGTVVFPEATLKVFLTASAESRAKRRFKQLKEQGIHSNIDDLVADLKRRDAQDSGRAVAPLVPAADAKILDSSDLTLEETVLQVLQWYSKTKA